MSSFKLTELNSTATTAGESMLYVADTTDSGVSYDSKQISVANFLSAYDTSVEIDQKISDLIGGAPDALNTLKELADALSGADGADIVGNMVSMVNANETHVDNMATLTGVPKDDATLGTFTGSVIGAGRDIKTALQLLETTVDTLGSATAVSNAQSGVDSLSSLSGVIAGSTNLGEFTGAVIDDDVSIKAALQALETALEAEVEARGSDVDSEETRATQAESALDTKIDNEILARAQAITGEANARTGADNAIIEDVGELVSLSGVVAGSTDLGSFSGTTIGNAKSIYQALQALETAHEGVDQTVNNAVDAINNTLTTDIDAVEADVAALTTLSGVPSEQTHLGTFTGTTVGNSKNVHQAIQALITAHEAEVVTRGQAITDERQSTVNDVAAEALIRTNADNAQVEDISELVALSGMISGSTDLGTFFGSTIGNNKTVKEALESLETALETDISALATLDTAYKQADNDLQTNLDAEALARSNADSGKVDKNSKINEHLIGEALPQAEPASYLFMVVDQATGQLKSISKSFLETEASA